VVLALTTSLLLSSAAPGTADDEEDLQQRRHQVQDEIGGAQTELDESSKQLQRATAALTSAQDKLDSARSALAKTRGQLSTARARDEQMQLRLDAAEEELASAQADFRAGKLALHEARLDVARDTVENIQNGDPGLRAFGDLLRGEEPSTFSDEMSLQGSLTDAQTASVDEYDAGRVLHQLNRDRIKKLRDEVAKQRKAAAENLALRVKLESAAETQTAEVGELVDTTVAARGEAAKARKSDLAQLEALESERSSLSERLRAIARRQAARREAARQEAARQEAAQQAARREAARQEAAQQAAQEAAQRRAERRAAANTGEPQAAAKSVPSCSFITCRTGWKRIP